MSSSQGSTRTVMGRTAIGMAGNAVGAFEPLLTLAVVHRFGAAVWGQYLLAEFLCELSTRVGNLGLDSGFVWWIPSRRQEDGTYRLDAVYGSVAVAMIVSSGVALLAALLIPYLPSEYVGNRSDRAAMWIVLASVPFYAGFSLVLQLGRGLGTMLPDAVVSSVSIPLLIRGIPLALAGLDLGVTAIAIGHTVSYVVGLALAIVFTAARMKRVATDRSKVAFFPPVQLLRFSLANGAAGFLSASMVRLDTAMLAAFMDARTVGIYGVVAPLAASVRAIRNMFYPATTPIVTEAYALRRTEDAALVLRSLAFTVSSLAVPTAAFFILSATPILAMYGEEFVAGGAALIWLSVGYVFFSAPGLSNTVLIASGKSRLAILSAILPVFVNFPLNYWWIPHFGMSGAAAATAVTATVVSAYEYFVARRLLGRDPSGLAILEPVVVGSVLCCGLMLAPDMWGREVDAIVRVAAFALAYGAWLWVRAWPRIRVTLRK